MKTFSGPHKQNSDASFLNVSGTRWRVMTFYALTVLWISLTFSSAISEISFTAALLFWFSSKISSRSILPSRKAWASYSLLAIFLLISILSYFWSEYQDASFRGVFKIAQQVAIYFMVTDIFGEGKQFRFFHKIFLGIFVVVVLNGLIQYYFGKDLIRGFQPLDASAGLRVSSSFKTYGLLASYLICALPVVVSLLFTRDPKMQMPYKVVAAAASVSGLVVLYLTRSRGAFLAVIIGFLFLLILNRKFKLLVLLFFVAGSALFVMPKGMVIHLDAEGKEQSLVERFYLWDRAVSVIKAKPLTGTGINTYARAHAKYDTTQNWRVKDYYAHNGYLQLAAETGLPALLLFLSFLFAVIIGALQNLFSTKAPPEHPVISWGYFTGVLSFLIFTLVDTVLHSPQAAMTFWFLIGLLTAYTAPLQTKTGID